VQIGNNDANGALPSGTVTVNGAFGFSADRQCERIYSCCRQRHSDQSGSGTVTLTGANAYTATPCQQRHAGLEWLRHHFQQHGAPGQRRDVRRVRSRLAHDPDSLSLGNANVSVVVSASGCGQYRLRQPAFSGAANHLKRRSLPPIASYPVTFTIIQSAGAASGTFNVCRREPARDHAGLRGQCHPKRRPVGRPAHHHQRPHRHSPTVSWTGADVPTSTPNWSDRPNWQLPGAHQPGTTSYSIIQGPRRPRRSRRPAAAQRPRAGLREQYRRVQLHDLLVTYTNLNSTYHNTFIANNATLTLPTV